MTTRPHAEEAVAFVLMAHGAKGTASTRSRGGVRVTAHFPQLTATRSASASARVSHPPEPVAAVVADLSRVDDDLGLDCRSVVTWGEVDDEDWAESWKRFYKPLRIGRHLLIAPTWEAVEPTERDVLIRMDPKMAFGTGIHATTQLCLMELEARVRPGWRVLDVGTGSGILSVAALRLGASSVVAVDNDPLAVAVAKENLAANGFAPDGPRCRVLLAEGVPSAARLRQLTPCPRGRRGAAPPTRRRFDLAVANISEEVICDLAGPVAQVAERFIASGFTGRGRRAVREAVARAGWQADSERSRRGWVLVSCARRAGRASLLDRATKDGRPTQARRHGDEPWTVNRKGIGGHASL